MKFEGIYTPIVTPFQNDGSIDYGAFGEVIDWQVENGVHGIIVSGSTGEFYALSKGERIAQFRFAAERIAGRATFIAGVNDIRVDECLEITAAARDAGADALLVAAPPYSLPSSAELAAHVAAVDRAAGLPIMLYNYPGRTGVSMDEAFLDLVAGTGNVAAIKESAGDAGRIQMLASQYPQLQLTAGAEDLVLEFYAWGAKSWVCVTSNFFPRACVRFHEICAIGGDFDTGRRIMAALLPLMNLLEKSGKFVQCVKRACERRGRPGGSVRLPLLPLDDTLAREADAIIDQTGAALTEIIGEV
ncbi:MAG: dihydrodipicolinate synthase family protein [Hyphomicrobiales bacterium]|nr:dihydrodipicolinate synthase family protein [Hyphomicrobiales bacterium]